MFMSRNVTLVWLVSFVKLIVGCSLLSVSMKDFSWCSVCVHTMKMSSMYRLYMRGLSFCFFRKGSSIECMNILAYAGAIFVPMAVPWSCVYVLLLNVNMLSFNT